ncbi:MAG: hypothetical protein HOV94_01920, partial [Saccharothrix sp.]|nr:hypothetical protein [Saccharothrix sp.]
LHVTYVESVRGMVEDRKLTGPASGAAAAALGGYLRTLGLVDRPRAITVHQGVDLGRPSLLKIAVTPDDPRVAVTGSAVPITADDRPRAQV